MASFASPFTEMAYCNLICKISHISTKHLSSFIQSMRINQWPQGRKDPIYSIKAKGRGQGGPRTMKVWSQSKPAHIVFANH